MPSMDPSQQWYECGICGKRWIIHQPGRLRCLVNHDPGTCCHQYEREFGLTQPDNLLNFNCPPKGLESRSPMASYDWKVSALKAAKQLFLTVAAAVVAAGIAALTTPEFNAQLKALVEGVAGSIPVVGKVLVPALYSAVLGVVAAAAAAGLNWKKNHNL